jgi:tetratricopeptide (TPR) repeat protein
MLSIFAQTDLAEHVRRIIASVERLDELVTIEEYQSAKHPATRLEAASEAVLIIDSTGIQHTLDWMNESPPYLLPARIPLHDATLLSCVFARLGNWEQVHTLLTEPRVEIFTSLYAEFDVVNRLQNGIPLAPLPVKAMSDFDEPSEAYRAFHNAAITRQYAVHSADRAGTSFEEIVALYKQSLEIAPDLSHTAFTTLHFATLLLDAEQAGAADYLLQTAIQHSRSIHDIARFALKSLQNSVWLQQVTVPYNTEHLEKLKTQLWETLQYFEKTGRTVQAALTLVDASQIANMLNSFSESLGYISRAVALLENEELPELLGSALYRKGTLLFTWAQQGSPQFYKPAMQAYQETLKIFDRDTAPRLFADVHHHLGVIYSEMPDDAQKRHIWAALSTSSFKEALDFYTKERYPYDYAMVCTSLGNAFTKFPEGVRTDHYEKAIEYYREALTIRSSEDFPEERALTLLNFLEANWYVSNGTKPENDWNEARYEEMLAAVEEIPRLSKNAELVREAEQHSVNLARLKDTVENKTDQAL